MNFYVLDVNIILDNFDTLRRSKYPTSVEVYDYLRARKNGCISSSSLDNIKFLKVRDLILDKGYTKRDAEKIVKYILKDLATHFKILKTPSYVDVDDEDIEDAQIIATAKAIGSKVITRDEAILRKYPEFSLRPEEFLMTIHKQERISMLNLTLQTLSIYEEIEALMDKVMQKSNFILGEEVKDLEARLSEYIGTMHAIGVASGTDALLLNLRALSIKKKGKEYWDREDLIITTPFTFTATGDTILRAGATPLFVDIDPETFNIDPVEIKGALKEYGQKVVGIVPVHLYGLACHMDEILEIAGDNNLFVIEDCAQAFGAKYRDRKVGSLGDTGCFSFFPSKNLGAFGDAGAITTSDNELAEIIRMLRVHGGRDKYNVDHIGYKARLDTIQAAVLLAKLKHIDEYNAKRRNIAEHYTEELKKVGILKPPSEYSGAYHVYHQYTIRVGDNKRDELQKYLKEHGIDSMVYYPVPLHKMNIFIKNRMEVFGSLENSEIASKSVLSLPIEPLIDIEQLKRIIETIKNFSRKE